MKKTITSVLSILTISISLYSQSVPDNNATASTSGYEYPKMEYAKWKEDRVESRRDFYAAKTSYDPAAEYEPIYKQKAASGLVAKTEKGNAKLMDGNAKVQVAYYNNANVGTILKLTNPGNGKITYAIVVGKIPPTESASYVVMVSDRVARNIGLKDYSSIESSCYIPVGQ